MARQEGHQDAVQKVMRGTLAAVEREMYVCRELGLRTLEGRKGGG